jgi:hypothetical protein
MIFKGLYKRSSGDATGRAAADLFFRHLNARIRTTFARSGAAPATVSTSRGRRQAHRMAGAPADRLIGWTAPGMRRAHAREPMGAANAATTAGVMRTPPGRQSGSTQG